MAPSVPTMKSVSSALRTTALVQTLGLDWAIAW